MLECNKRIVPKIVHIKKSVFMNTDKQFIEYTLL